MPDAGRVTIEVDLGAAGLGEKLTAAVHRAVTRAQAAIHDFSRSTGSIDDRGFRRTAASADAAGDAIRRAAEHGRTFTSVIANLLTGHGAGSGGGLPGLRKEIGEYHGVVGQVKLGFDRFLAGLVTVGAAASTLLPIVGLLGGAIGVLGGGIGVALGGVGQLTAGMVALGPAIAGIVGAVKIGIEGLKDGAKAYLKQFDDANAVLAAQIGNLMGPLLTAWQEVSSRIKLDFATALVPTFNNLGALFRSVGPGLSGVATGVAEVANHVTATLNALAPQLNTVLAGSRTLITAIGPGIQTLAAGFVTMSAAAQQAMPTIAAAINGALTQVGQSFNQIAASPQFQTALQGFAQIITQIGGLIAGLGPTMVNLGAQVGPLFADFIARLGPALDVLLKAFGDISTRVGPLFNEFLSGLAPALATVIEGLGRMGEIVGPTLVPLLNALGQALAPLYEPLARLGANLSEQLTRILPTIGTALATIVEPFVSALPTMGDLIIKLAEAVNAAQPLIVELARVIGTLLDVAIQLLDQLTPVIETLGRIPGLVDAVVAAFLAWKFIAGIEALQVALTGIAATLSTTLPAAAATGAAGIAAKLAAVTVPAWLAYLVAGGSVAAVGSGLSAAHERGLSPEVTTRFPELGPGPRSPPQVPTAPQVAGPPSGAYRPGGPGATGGATPGHPGVTVQLPRDMVAVGPPEIFGLPGPSTPVAPDIKAPGGAAPTPPTPPEVPITDQPLIAQTEAQTKLLTDIRALLAGTGNSSAPLNSLKDLKSAVTLIGQDLKKTLPAAKLPPGAVPGRIGPFGTPVPAYDPAYEAAAGALRGLGMANPETIIGQNPIAYAQEQWNKQVDATAQGFNTQIDAWQQSLEWQKKLEAYQQKVWAYQQKTAGQPVPGGPPVPGGQTAIPGMPSTGPVQVPAVAGLDQASIAKAVFSAVTAAGYGPQVGQAAVAAGLLESGLNPAATNAGHVSLFQTSADKNIPRDPAAQIAWFVNELNKQGGPAAANLDPLNFIADRIEKGGYPGADYTKFLGQAQQLIGAGGVPLAGPTAPGLPGANIATAGAPIPVWVVGSGPMTAITTPGATTPGIAPSGVGGGAGLGVVAPRSTVLRDTGPVPSGPAAANAAALITQYFPQISEIGGSRPAGTAVAGTHDVGKAIDISIPNYASPQGIALGNQIRDFLQQNAQQLGVVYTIWQNQVQNTGLGGRAAGPGGTVEGHLNHIDTQFADTFGAGQVTAPGLPGANIATTGSAIPVFVTNWPGQAPQQQGQQGGFPGAPILDAGINAAGAAASNVAGQVVDAFANVGLEPWRQQQPAAPVATLANEGNPLALAAAAGFAVPDFTRQGGVGTAAAPAVPFDASGRMFSDTSALIDRSFTSLAAHIDAMKEQILQVLNEVKQAVSEEVLKPIIQSAIDTAFRELSAQTTSSIGKTLGEAAGPPIADSVANSMPAPTTNTGPGSVGTLAGNTLGSVVSAVMDEGGEWPTGTIAANLSGMTEYVLTGPEYAAAKEFATVGGVVGNATVGADFFGVSQVPILGMIINILVEVLLAIIGVEIKVRDTLQELTGEFRAFRGDMVKYFTAEGQMLNDTSALIERSLSSSQAATDERVAILSKVIAGTIQFVITQVVIPVGKAVANAAIDAGASAAGAAVTGASFGVPAGGQAVSALISSAGHAGVEIAGDIATTFVNAATPVLVGAVAEGLQGLLPGVVRGVFSGRGLAIMFDPIGHLLGSIIGGGLVGGGAWGTVGGLFDSGGMATGTGLMPKANPGRELMLSPQHTDVFERFVRGMEAGNMRGNTTINSPMHVIAGQNSPEQIHDRLLSLLS